MKLTVRAKFMLGLVVQTLVVYVVLGAILYGFNLHERHEHIGKSKEEKEEFEIVMGLAALSIPIVLLIAWQVSLHLLKPLQKIVDSAEMIREGALDHRVEPDVPDDEIGRLARTINEAFDSYHRALERLDRFSFDAAHQLRNPLAAIRTTAEVCLQHQRVPADYQDALGRVLEDANRLSHTVDQLLMLARLGRADISAAFEKVDAVALVRHTLDALVPVLDENEIALRSELPAGPVMVRGIPRLLEQALANILDNAARFTPRSGTITVEMQRSGAGKLELNITDTGPGIPESLQDSLFRRWAEGFEHEREGSGLGLAIAADIIRVHNGTIGVSSSDDGGSCFTIRLSVADGSPPRTPEHA
jgi:signal transduction histidine kinase